MKKSIVLCILLLVMFCAAPAFGEGYDTGRMKDFPLAAPGEAGYDVQRVLAVAKGTGFLKELSTGEETYRDKYVDAIKAMEQAYDLTADGTVMYSEMKALDLLVFPGKKSSRTKVIIEKLCDLGYINGPLPETHDQYQQSYVSGVKKAEKELKLTEDGILTETEYNRIKSRNVPAPAKPTNVKVNVSGTTATISWSSVKGARYYEVYESSRYLGTTKGTSYTAKNLEPGITYVFNIIACTYTRSSQESDNAFADLFRKPNAQELSENFKKWTWQNIKMNDAYHVSKTWESADLYYLVKKSYNGRTYYFYYRLTDARSWNWRDGTPIYNRKPTNIDIEGYCTETSKSSSYGTLPVIEVTSISYSY